MKIIRSSKEYDESKHTEINLKRLIDDDGMR